MIKKISMAAAFVCSSVFATAALAEPTPLELKACTKDGKTATMHFDMDVTMDDPAQEENLSRAIEEATATERKAFLVTAALMNGDELRTISGQQVFQIVFDHMAENSEYRATVRLHSKGKLTIGNPSCTPSPP